MNNTKQNSLHFSTLGGNEARGCFPTSSDSQSKVEIEESIRRRCLNLEKGDLDDNGIGKKRWSQREHEHFLVQWYLDNKDHCVHDRHQSSSPFVDPKEHNVKDTTLHNNHVIL